jgi:hypothetical protein
MRKRGGRERVIERWWQTVFGKDIRSKRVMHDQRLRDGRRRVKEVVRAPFGIVCAWRTCLRSS